MLYATSDSTTYMIEFRRRFSNFADKSPMKISYNTSPQGVQIVDEFTNKIYDIDWKWSIDVKAFIHGIKQLLIKEGCYPSFYKVTEQEESIGKDETIALAVSGTPLEDIPIKRTRKVVEEFLIDKVIVFKDYFIIKSLTSGKMFRYALKKSCIFFLNDLRSGKKTKEQAGDFFFKNSELLNEITIREEE